jgi:hypothetical protein
LTVKEPASRALFWAPRALCLLFAAFISLFALDVFGAGYSFWETIAAVLIHLIPTAIILAALAVAWRWEWVGAVVFTGLSVWYLVTAWGQFPWTTYLVISGPAFLVAVLFLINWLRRAEIRSTA